MDADWTSPRAIAYELHNNARRLDWLERFAKPGRLVDIGGGIGTMVEVARDRGWDAMLLEPVPAAVEMARANGLPAQCGGVEDLDPSHGRFDAATLVHVLEHLPAASIALGRVADILQPGGYVFIEVPNYASVSRRASKQDWLGWRPGQHVHFFEPKTLGATIRRAGLEVMALHTIALKWDGNILLHYAHITGLEPTLMRLVGIRRRLRREGSPDQSASVGLPPTVDEEKRRVIRRLGLKTMDMLVALQERSGTAENIVAVARKP